MNTGDSIKISTASTDDVHESVLPNGFYMHNNKLLYVFAEDVYDTNGRGLPCEPYTEFKYYDFVDKRIYHISEQMAEMLEFVEITDDRIIARATSTLECVVDREIRNYDEHFTLAMAIGYDVDENGEMVKPDGTIFK
jgi:hypothetical protein